MTAVGTSQQQQQVHQVGVFKLVIEPFFITFDNPSGIFRAGDLLSGFLNIGFSEPTKLTCIRVDIYGIVSVAFIKRNITVDHKRKTFLTSFVHRLNWHHSDTEQCFAKKCYLFGDESQPISLHKGGTTRYKLEVPLPRDLLPSVEYSFGNIRYYCEAVVFISDDHVVDQDCVAPFIVQSVVDLTKEPELIRRTQTQRYIAEAPSTCGGSGGGSVHLLLQLERGGYVPGETIRFIVTINNKTSNQCPVEIALEEWMQFRVKPYKIVKTKHPVLAKSRKEVKPKREERWDGSLIIPDKGVNVGRLDGCNLISLRHVILLQATLNFGCTVALEQEVLIGHIPLYKTPARK